MRTLTVTLNDLGELPRAKYAALPALVYRVAFRDDSDRAMSVMRLRPGKSAKAQAITCPEARAAIAAALAQIATPAPASIKPRDPAAADKPYSALERLARIQPQKELA